LGTNQGSFNHMFQLAHITGPGMAQQFLQGGFGGLTAGAGALVTRNGTRP
jgi:hypothetical protein